ncbi:hypothetical protein Tco_1094604 [Tanacetum coccineum]|uniref:Uncharacterized protein n=1 Tax=Tanacetum coccineum TaxID=301880 RepID=A0ABQ5II34_9ASTR
MTLGTRKGIPFSRKKCLSNDPFPLPKNESSNFYHHDDPSSPRPPPKPPDVEVFFDFETDTGILTTKVVKGIFEHYVLMPNILAPLPTLDPDLDFNPSHDSLGSRNKIFNPGIFIEVQSERLLSRDEFSISFIRDSLSLVFDTLLPFSSENKGKDPYDHEGPVLVFIPPSSRSFDLLLILESQFTDHILEMDGMWSRYGVRTLRIRGYGGGGDMVVNDRSKGCLDPRILRSSPLLPPLYHTPPRRKRKA